MTLLLILAAIVALLVVAIFNLPLTLGMVLTGWLGWFFWTKLIGNSGGHTQLAWSIFAIGVVFIWVTLNAFAPAVPLLGTAWPLLLTAFFTGGALRNIIW